MSELTYHKLLGTAYRLYREGRYQDGIDYLNRHAHKVEGNRAQIYNFLYALTARAGQTNLALAILQEAVEEQGFWWSGRYLRSDEDLEPLRKYDEFERLLRICEEREAEARRRARPQLKVLAPAPQSDARLVVALHGNHDNNAINEPYWRKVAEDGHVLALAQSSDEDSSDAFVWNDHEEGARELQAHLAELHQRYGIPPERTVLGGFSAGGRVVLYAALVGMVKAHTLLLVGPWLPQLEEWAPRLDALKGTNVRIVVGDQDEDCLGCSQRLAELLNERGVRCELRLIEGLEHDYPDDFERDIEAALSD